MSCGGELKMPAKAKAKQSTAGPGQVSISASVKIILIFQEKLLAAKKTICAAINTTNKHVMTAEKTDTFSSCDKGLVEMSTKFRGSSHNFVEGPGPPPYLKAFSKYCEIVKYR